jgi:hypothetical protein
VIIRNEIRSNTVKMSGILVTVVLLLGGLVFTSAGVLAATDGFYTLTEVAPTPAWDGTDGSRLKTPTEDYNYTYGDEASLSYVLPWAFKFYGQSFSQINVDTNGNVWFGPTGLGPVITAWNNDLSSYYYGGVFVQHNSAPERIVIEWLTETYTEEGQYVPNRFKVILYKDGPVRIDYKSFATAYGEDFGSGVSRGEGIPSLSVTDNYGYAFGLANRSFTITTPPTVQITSPVGITASTTPTLTYSASGGTVSVTVDNVVVGKVSGQALATLPNGVHTITVVTTDSLGASSSASSTFTVDPTASSTLSVTVDGSGSGSVNSNPSGVSCASGICTNSFSSGGTFSLYQSASNGSQFSGWGGACSGIGPCDVYLNTPAQSVTATFDIIPGARILGSPQPYGLLQSAYNDAVSDAIIQAKVGTFVENLGFSVSKNATLSGGYDGTFATQPGFTVLQGTLLIRQGRLAVDHLKIK